MSGLQPSASRTELLLNCQYPFGRIVPRETEVSEPARYGLAFHELMADMLRAGRIVPLIGKKTALKWKVDYEEVVPHVRAAFNVLDVWLSGKNPWGVNFRAGVERTEASFALGGGGLGGARSISNPTEDTHEYLDLKNGEIGGTVDYLSIGDDVEKPRFKLIIDHKTGFGDFSNPQDLPQLQTLASMADLLPGTPRTPIIAGILHADRQGVPTVYVEELPSLYGEQFYSNKIRPALAKIGDGSLRPGPHCEHCPARPICPARDGEIIRSALELLPKAAAIVKRDAANDLVSGRDLGRLHVLIKEFEKLIVPAKEEIKAAVQAGAFIERPDGKVLVLKTRSYETLSKGSIERALGKLRAAKEIARLRKLGCTETQEREEIHAED
jgi:hypothetical protein